MNAPCGQEDCGHTIEVLVKSLATSRALVEKVKEGLHCHYVARGLDKCSTIDGATLCSACLALALTEEKS